MTMSGTFMEITGATSAMYTPGAEDDGYYLQATAMYDDRPRLWEDHRWQRRRAW